MIRTKRHRRAAVPAVVLGLGVSALMLVAFGERGAIALPPQVGSHPPASAPAGTQDPAALGLLRRMCDRLRTAKTLTVGGRSSLELPLAGGELATFYNDFDTAVRHPDGLAAHRIGDLPEFRFVFDGKAMTVHVPDNGDWATTTAPATLDALLPAMAAEGGLNMPFDELLVADPYSAITAGVTEAVLAREASIQGKKVAHLVLSSAQYRMEYWIDSNTALPARSLVVYIDHPLRPHFIMEYAEWKLDPVLPSNTFTLPKPKGATEASFRKAASAFQ